MRAGALTELNWGSVRRPLASRWVRLHFLPSTLNRTLSLRSLIREEVGGWRPATSRARADRAAGSVPEEAPAPTTHAGAVSVSQAPLRSLASVQYAGVGEYQARGMVDVHTLIRLDVLMLTRNDALYCYIVLSILTGARTAELQPVIRPGATAMDSLLAVDTRDAA